VEKRLKKEIEKLKGRSLYRKLSAVCPQTGGRMNIDGRVYYNLSSNDYLGLSEHKTIIKAAKAACEPVFGTASSRLMTGSLLMHETLEGMTARFKKKEAALVFNSGYQLNVGVVSALAGKEDVIFADKLSHASLIDGILLSGARFFRFRHNDTVHLEDLLKKERGKYRDALIVTESVFSMDGDIAPLDEIVRLKKKYGAFLMVDEAHAAGLFGPTGAGVLEERSLEADTDLIMGTFSKALGSFGAYAATSSVVREYLINKCRSFIYSTALPQSVINADIAALSVVKKERYKAREVLDNAAFLRETLRAEGYKVLGASQIIPIVLGTAEEAVALSGKLRDKGYWATPVRPPTVPEGASRVRISVTYHTGRNVLDRLVRSMR
jgi:8-amino-7-oxononanoate synthase